jgi:hypothetical protein
VPFAPRHINEIPAAPDVAAHVYDVELPYRRLGRCRVSERAAFQLGTGLDQVAVALSTYEERNGRSQTASELLGPGVDLGEEGHARSAPTPAVR